MKKKFGERLRYVRKNKGLKQLELANDLKLTRQSVSNWEHGLALPDVTALINVCNILDVTPDYLLGFSNYYNEQDRGEIVGRSTILSLLNESDVIEKYYDVERELIDLIKTVDAYDQRKKKKTLSILIKVLRQLKKMFNDDMLPEDYDEDAVSVFERGSKITRIIYEFIFEVFGKKMLDKK